ncbi:alpha/beta fold hydrolase [Nocardia sp. CDC159]|uniref:Alpha/beta fold hydrolase n=1 Tax=Nocardia pulmonis TaxID=2951408 RepID=A0A9X2J0E2_9NOCA|nr:MULTISPECIES: alpha/beta hydrolase [Nocardia]MCM6778463.1 alpha/beta fold hydrolase [Nocardia pulmonis]MCM6791352.1 alpha/beta fold hydrolase [Nocardia sp. CDC159]
MTRVQRRCDVSFDSQGTGIAGWVYRPAAATTPSPVLVMAHGLGAVKEMRLDAFAERFADAGITVLVFDYRHFGASDGTPRQLLSIRRQLDDWQAAIAYARKIEGVDASRVALFGTSFSGGHVLRAALHDGHIAAVVSQCPFTDGPASTPTIGPRAMTAVTARALADLAAAALGRSPVKVPLTALPNHTALMNAADVVPGYSAMIPASVQHPNYVAARIGLSLPFYRPGRALETLRCPVFLAVCTEDSVAPAQRTLRYARKGGANIEVREYSAGHFDVYLPPTFETVVADEIRFLRRHLDLTGVHSDQ